MAVESCGSIQSREGSRSVIFQALLADLKTCSKTRNLERGKQVHAEAEKRGYNSDLYVASTLINMYAKCGRMVEARQVFDSMKQPSLVSWTALVLGYANNGQDVAALEMFKRMAFTPDSVAIIAALKACTSLAVKGGRRKWSECRERGRELHELAVKIGCGSDSKVINSLMDMYSKCGSTVHAHELFDSLKHPDVVSWTTLMLGYADNGDGYAALRLFTRMRREGPAPDRVTFAAALKVCALLGALEYGRTLHLEVEKLKEIDLVLVNSIVDFYAKCGSLMEARSVFDLHAKRRDVVTWNALLAGFSGCGDYENVLKLFREMRDEGLQPDYVTFISFLKCCNHAGLVDDGKECFDSMSTKYGVLPMLEHYTCMVDIFGRRNRLGDAMALLQLMHCSADDIAWTTILGGCCKWRNLEIGRLAFQSLLHFNDQESGAYTLMGRIYASRGMVYEHNLVMEMREMLKPCTQPEETCWTNELGEANIFLVTMKCNYLFK